MVSFWSKKKDTPVNGQGEEQPHRADEEQQTARQEPDERTRLLPRENGNYLSPDDPAVSPYNLWSIRALRALSSFFLGITFVWWTFLLVSIFVSPPMMHTRGSGFFGFAFTTLTLSYIIIALLFFAVPSQPMTIWGIVLSIFLLVDMIIIVSVPRIRVEEGWVGIASVVWATVIALYHILQNRSVAWGKREEEERLTGREEPRRSFKEWFAVFAQSLGMAVLGIISILFTATLILRARDASLAASGQKYLVNGDSYEVHLACIGSRSTGGSGNESQPTVLVEGGEGPVEHTLQPFIDELYQNGQIPRYCYWDRPGLAFSDNAPSPYSAGMTIDALTEALALAGEEGPWVLVSAGVGGIYSRIFASRHMLEIDGMLLIDSLHEDFLGSKIGAPGRGFLLWLRGILSPLGLDRLAGAIFKGRTREDRVYGRSAYQSDSFIRAKLQENLVANTMTSSEIQTARHVLMPETPVVVVSSGVEVRKDARWAKAQEDLTVITRSLKNWDIVRGAPHEVWLSVDGRQLLQKRLSELVRGN